MEKMIVGTTTYPVKKDEKYGVYNITDKWVESHHRSEKAADRKCNSRQKHWGKEKQFKVVEIKGNI
jgi:hypothetical protein